MEHPIVISSKGKLHRSSRFRFIRELIEKARLQIMKQEDDQMFKTLEAISKND